MCVAIPARVVEITEGVPPMASIDLAGRPDRCCLAYLPEAKVGDYVLVQNGFAVEVMDADTAAECLAVFIEIGAMPFSTPSMPLR